MHMTSLTQATVVLLLHAYMLQAGEIKPEIQKVPDEYRCVPSSVGEVLHPFTSAHVMWPDAQEIGRRRADSSEKPVREAVDSTVTWLKRILREEWIPDISSLDILALKSDVQGHDAVRFRYRVEGVVIEVASTVSRMTIVIQPGDNEIRRSSLQEVGAKHYVSSVVDEFLQKADEVKRGAFRKVKKTKSGFTGSVIVTEDTGIYWCDFVAWWTDGRTVVFSIDKADGGAWIPTPRKHWFSKSEE